MIGQESKQKKRKLPENLSVFNESKKVKNGEENSEQNSGDDVQLESEEEETVENEEEFKVNHSFNMKKFREKLREGDFILGKCFLNPN